MTHTIVSFYYFKELSNYEEMRLGLESLCAQQNLKGTIILASEGINGTIAGSQEGIDTLLNYLRQQSRFPNLEVKESVAEQNPFRRLKVKAKKEIVTFGIPVGDRVSKRGTPIQPQEWNQLISDPEVTVIDTRNDYEVGIGTFQGAKDPQLKSFREFPHYAQEKLHPQKQKKIAMFCTGGIRCEKASAYLLEQGFEQVYQLQGGILKYLEQVPPQESKWQGECFVFDERVSVDENLQPGTYTLCPETGSPVLDGNG
ncbi:MAG: rhodanese-related sulfurtransferase [Spirulinaceae cyanobacterium]